MLFWNYYPLLVSFCCLVLKYKAESNFIIPYFDAHTSTRTFHVNKLVHSLAQTSLFAVITLTQA